MAGDVWLNHRQAINCRGKRFDGTWTGTEHMAFGPVAYNRDTARILATLDDVAADIYERAVQTGIDEARKAMATEHGPPCATCGKPSSRLIAGKNYCDDHGEPQPIPPAVLKLMAGTAAPATDEEAMRARADAGREILLQQLDREYEPERAARGRLFQQFEALREDVFTGKVRVRARWPGQTEIRPLILEELRSGYPADPHETRIELPSLPLPITLVFSKADIDVLPPRSMPIEVTVPSEVRTACAPPQRRARGEYIPELKSFLFADSGRAARVAVLTDMQVDSSKNRLFLITNRPLLGWGMRGIEDGGATGIFR